MNRLDVSGIRWDLVMALAAVVVFCFIGRDWLNGLTLDVLHYFEAPAHVSTGKP
ncbi:hypothetical protein [Salinisphaera orenii]|uniref:Uncharacterized protein n=1 Tax=Salinisphaera orenii YIM 95161 TaxID=1051139 RepID=A0A423PU98_9GAMM|nr:hypothetical protein [Salinisphaera halophila]ROO29169.1 hypothetical protein SAHL_09440 [Salinisphaera halophila YIM 95161]